MDLLFFERIKKYFSVPEVVDRLKFTFLVLLVYRFGSFVILPSVDYAMVESTQNNGNGASGLLGLLDVFVGGAFSNISILALGIMPYISASIIVQLLSAIIPQLQKMRSEGESGTRRISQITRYLAILIAFVQAFSYVNSYASPYMVHNSGILDFGLAILALVAGAFFVIWLADRITEKGLGNGASVIMLAGILSRFPQAFTVGLFQNITSIPIFVLECIGFLVMIFLAVILSVAVRKIPIFFAKKTLNAQQTENLSTEKMDYIPFKLNFSGVMPIIFAQTVLVVPAYFLSKIDSDYFTGFSDPFSVTYNVMMVFLIFVFSYLYSALVFNSKNLADELKSSGVFIPGCKPGADTAFYIDQVVSNLILPGAIFLSLHTIMPVIARKLGVSPEFSFFFGGTSLLIVVSVGLDLLSQIRAMSLQVGYDKYSTK